MKKLLSASAAVAALFAAAPAFAQSGHLDVSYTDIDEDADVSSINFAGAGVVDAGGGWSVQGDAVVHRLDISGSNGNFTDAGLHLFQRNDSWAAGAYADSSDIQMISAFGFGLEGQKYFDRVTLTGSIGWNTAEAFGSDFDGWNVTAGATVFVTDNVSLGADVGYADIDTIDGITVWSLSAEFKPDTMPVSFFAGYSDQDEGGFMSSDLNSWTIGARWNFGGGTLKDRDRSGASMKGGLGFGDMLF